MHASLLEESLMVCQLRKKHSSHEELLKSVAHAMYALSMVADNYIECESDNLSIFNILQTILHTYMDGTNNI